MEFGIRYQESYSRGELLLRSLFGWLYISIPHAFLLLFLMIASSFVTFISFWAILFTGQYPEGMFNFQLKLQRWSLRVNARLMNLSDGYPAFGLNSNDENIKINISRQENYNRLSVLLRTMFGFLYVYIPHIICLMFLQFGAMFVRIIAFWAVLFTGKYPEGMHKFMVGVMRWGFRINIYMSYMTDVYPPFSTSGNEASFGQSSNDGELLDS
jgi:hypothetical protein